MVRFGRFLLFALLAFWLPATMHCRLEAAGFFEAHDHCADEQSASTSTDCKDDACPTVEEALYKESAPAYVLIAPEIFRFVALIGLPEASVAPDLSPCRHDLPPELAVSWQFIARAAPPARAPSLNT